MANFVSGYLRFYLKTGLLKYWQSLGQEKKHIAEMQQKWGHIVF